MKHKILAGLVLLSCGCTNTRNGVHSVSINGVQQAVESASFSTRKAVGSATRAKLSLMAATRETSALLRVATPAQRTPILQLKTTLEETRGEIDSTLTRLSVANGELSESAIKANALQGRIDAMGVELAGAQDAQHREKARADFWRGAALKLGILSIALGVWIFRRPLAVLMGEGI